jgi:hypothetical protein
MECLILDYVVKKVKNKAIPVTGVEAFRIVRC